jgi:ligand-binding sensor domain-containing protein
MLRSLFFPALLFAGCQPDSPKSATASAVPVQNVVSAEQVAEYPLGPMEDAEGNLWLGSVGSGAMMWNGERLRYFHRADGLLGDRVTGLTRGPEGDLWFVSAEEHMGGGSALMRWDGAALRRAEHPAGFPENPTSPFFDSSGALWVQSGGQFHREVNGMFEPFPLPEPSLPQTNVTGYEPMNMREMRNGDFVFATSDQGVYRWDGSSFEQLTTADGLPTNNVTLHLEDREGNLWLSCFHWHLQTGEKRGALCRWDGETLTTFPEVPGLTGNEIYSVFEDRAGNIWICATFECIYRYDGETFTAYRQTEPARPEFSFGCNSIYQDRAGRMWFGLTGGLYRLEGDVLVNVTREGPWG